MKSKISASRLAKALASQGIIAERNGNIVKVISSKNSDIKAEILLPESFPLESKAISQLLAFAGVSHPLGGHVCRACATPDFHPGAPIPVGTIIVTESDFVIPEAIGRDVNCGLRLCVVDISLDRFLSKKQHLTTLLKGDILEASRNIPTTPQAMTALFDGGLGAFWTTMRRQANEGIFKKINFDQVLSETQKLFIASHVPGNSKYAPEVLQDTRRGTLRDPGLGTVGRGNHFLEIQMVEEILDRHEAYGLGVRQGQIAVMIHTGSRDVGSYVGQRWMDRAKNEWPVGIKHPESGIYGLSGPLVSEYLDAMHAAAHYADANRALLMEMVRQRFREVFGDVSMDMVCDVPHNIVLREGGLNVHRKGATPAHPGQPLLIPGSMGNSSFLLSGLGNKQWISSASHGAGRAFSRSEISWKAKQSGSLKSTLEFNCVTLNEDRIIEESDAAYKPIGPVIQSQVEEGLVKTIARMIPLLTFKA